MTLTTFVLVGTVLSFDTYFATLAFQTNPPTNGGESLAVLPITAIPCEASIGQKIYVVKEENQKIPIISCENMEIEDEQH
ncbi:hypothetical protein OAA09_01200 [bacterium]|nr:hypothetical protein [bacterium]